MKSFVFAVTLFVALTFSQPVHADAAKGKIPVVSGQKIAFLGDSITAAGANPGGYCRLVLDGLKKQGIEVTGIFAGIGGHKSNQMLARLEKDVLSKKPDWMTLSCGVNDVWWGKNGVKLPEYKINITAIVDKAQAQGIKVMLLTSTMIRENQKDSLNQQLLPYNAFLKELAKEKGCLFADLNADMQEALKKFPKDAPKGKQLTKDGVHMNAYGNYMMAKGVLETFSVSESKFPAMVEDWKKIPGGKSLSFRLGLSMSQYEYELLQSKYDKPLQQIFQDFLNKKKEKLLKK
jgi:lysophospholipase L1-like esterase